MGVIRWAVTGSFVLLAATGLRLWWRSRSPTTVWLCLMFSSLAAVRLISHLLPAQRAGLTAVLGVAVPAVLATFPYLLFRFTESFRPVAARWRGLITALAAVVVLATVAIFSGTAYIGLDLAWFTTFVFAVAGVWTALTGWVVWRLWSAGRRQPTVTRRRMWTMAVAAGLLNMALLLAVVEGADALAIAGEAVAFASAGTFVLAFAPPRFMRVLWRQADERALWQAEGDLVAADTREAVVSAVLPHIDRLLGGEGALFIDDAGRETATGLDPSSRDRVRRKLDETARDQAGAGLAGQVATLVVRQGRLGVATSAYAPLFGQDEVELMGWLGGLLDLALSRAELYDRERDARANAEEARARADDAKARAEAASAELEALLYGISHDLRTPIVSVRGYADCLAEDYAGQLDEDGRHFLSRLRNNVGYMEQLVGDLLKLSRAGSVSDRADEVELRDIAEQVADELRAAHPGAVIAVGELPRVLVDPPKARQVLTNLMTNAIVHSQRPDVLVRVDHVGGDADSAVIAVVDNGQGISKEDRHRAFEMFKTLQHSGGGKQTSGIGLAITRRIVENAGGEIWIEDSDLGADVRVRLPVPTRQAGVP